MSKLYSTNKNNTEIDEGVDKEKYKDMEFLTESNGPINFDFGVNENETDFDNENL